MLYRTHRSGVLVWLTLAALVLGFSLPGFVTTARATGQSIRFDELEAYVRAQSPRARILAQELVKVQAERDDALQWSNPEITYDHEDLEPFREWAVTLRKSFVMPFSHSKSREGWTERVHAAELRLDQDVSDLLADLKTGYVFLQLLDAYLTQLEQLEEIVAKASRVAEARHGEGQISGVDKHLIQLSVLALDASRRNALKERKEAAARWHAEIGIPLVEKTVLATPIVYKPVDLASPEEYVALLERRPGVRSRTVMHQALGKQAEAAKPSFVPGFDLYVGYKHIEPVLDGWVAGAALSLPLFDRKAGAARRLEADQRIAENKLKLYRSRSSDEIASLVHLIEDAGQALSSVAFRPDDGTSVLSSLFFSYQEGRYTLEAFLNAIQIEVTGSRGYYDQLYTYYENIFRLEAFTGAEIVSFSPEESEEK
jgi:outer membrane protein TolC